MRGTARRGWATGLVTVVMAVGLTACTGDPGSSGEGKGDGAAASASVPAACEGGTFAWSRVKETMRLTGATDVERVGEGGGTLRKQMERVYTPRVSVRADGPPIASEDVLFSLGKEVGEIDSDEATAAEAEELEGMTWSFTEVDREAPELNDGVSTVDNGGPFVQYEGVKTVTGDFRYSCPDGEKTVGHAESWRFSASGILRCDRAVDADLGRAAARRSCEEGSVATKSGA